MSTVTSGRGRLRVWVRSKKRDEVGWTGGTYETGRRGPGTVRDKTGVETLTFVTGKVVGDEDPWSRIRGEDGTSEGTRTSDLVGGVDTK